MPNTFYNLIILAFLACGIASTLFGFFYLWYRKGEHLSETRSGTRRITKPQLFLALQLSITGEVLIGLASILSVIKSW